MSQPYANELNLAALAVQRAALATKSVLATLDKGTLSKSDASPVTIADFAAQALLIAAVHAAYPQDRFVGEEAADALRSNEALSARVWDVVVAARLQDEVLEEGLGRPGSWEEMFESIDLGGRGTGGGEGRVWMLDPVDGTKTFMKGEQYAVCLGLVEDGVQRVGVVGLPNLPGGVSAEEGIAEERVDATGDGVMLFAVRGQGAFRRPMSKGALMPAERIEVREDVLDAAHVRAVNQRDDHLNAEKNRLVAERLGAAFPGTEIWAAQVRYAALAIGGGDFLVRIPRTLEYRVNTWDHIGGILIFEEVGGKVTDANGKPIDFGAGRKLEANFGIVAARKGIHERVLRVVQEVLKA